MGVFEVGTSKLAFLPPPLPLELIIKKTVCWLELQHIYLWASLASGVAALRKGMGIPLYKIPPSYILFMTPKIICSPKATHSRSLSRHSVFLRKQNPLYPQKKIYCSAYPFLHYLLLLLQLLLITSYASIAASQRKDIAARQYLPLPMACMSGWLTIARVLC